jgi:hypothetical protein
MTMSRKGYIECCSVECRLTECYGVIKKSELDPEVRHTRLIVLSLSNIATISSMC